MSNWNINAKRFAIGGGNMKKQTNKKNPESRGFFSRISKRLTSLTMQKAVVAVALLFILSFIATASNVIVKNGQVIADTGLGAGVTTTLTKLHIAHNSPTLAIFNRTGGSVNTDHKFTVTSGTSLLGESLNGILLASDDDLVLQSASGKNMYFGTDGSGNDLIIDSSGNAGLGIGMNAPSARLHVEYGSPTLAIFNRTGGSDNTDHKFTITSGTSLLGESLNGIALSSDDDLVLQSDVGKSIYFGANGTGTDMIVTSSGYVGIGTVSPSQKLHVQGNLNVTGSIWTNGGLVTTSPLIAESADGGQSIIGVKADDGNWVGCGAYKTANGYEWRCAPNAQVDAKLSKIEKAQSCYSKNKDYNEVTKTCQEYVGADEE